MTKSDLILRLAELYPHLLQRDIERIVGTVFDEISNALARGNRVELRGFGAFSIKQRDQRMGRNPRTGEAVAVAEKRVPFFKTGKQLRDRLNGLGRVHDEGAIFHHTRPGDQNNGFVIGYNTTYQLSPTYFH